MEQTVEYANMVSEQIEMLSEYDAKFVLAHMVGHCPDAFRCALDFLD
jgi:hypothetical protein